MLRQWALSLVLTDTCGSLLSCTFHKCQYFCAWSWQPVMPIEQQRPKCCVNAVIKKTWSHYWCHKQMLTEKFKSGTTYIKHVCKRFSAFVCSFALLLTLVCLVVVHLWTKEETKIVSFILCPEKDTLISINQAYNAHCNKPTWACADANETYILHFTVCWTKLIVFWFVQGRRHI